LVRKQLVQLLQLLLPLHLLLLRRRLVALLHLLLLVLALSQRQWRRRRRPHAAAVWLMIVLMLVCLLQAQWRSHLQNPGLWLLQTARNEGVLGLVLAALLYSFVWSKRGD
jgi:hypothetical protein